MMERSPAPTGGVAERPLTAGRPARAAEGHAADLLFINPPAPEGETWVRCQHRAAQRAPDGLVWPQVALAQLAALFPERTLQIIDANARRLSWRDVEEELRRLRPRWYVTQVAGPLLEHDLHGLAAAKQAGAATVAFGPLVTPVAYELLCRFPLLDYVICGEPEVALRELVDAVEGRSHARPAHVHALCQATAPEPRPRGLGGVPGLAWRREGEVILNRRAPLIPQLDALPLPAHQLLPLGAYCGPSVRAPAAVVVTGRGCPGECCFCLKHVAYRQTVRLRSPESILEELLVLRRLGVRHVYMQADLFTVCREQVRDLCRLIVAEGLDIAWSCSTRVDAVDAELLQWMAAAHCQRITWAIESGSDALLWRVGKRTRVADAERAITWARAAGISSWASFLIGLPGETEHTLRQTINLAKRLNVERVTFELAVPRPGTPFWEQALHAHWLRPGACWQHGDPSGPAIIEYPGLGAKGLEMALDRAYREWALRPGSAWGHLRRLSQPRAGWELGTQMLSPA